MPDRETAAHHEAAHAVVAVVQPSTRPLDELCIVDGHQGWFGQTVWGDDPGEWARFSQDELDAQGRVTAAGRHAHERFSETCTPAESDEWSSGDDDWLRRAAPHAVGRSLAQEAIESHATDAEWERARTQDELSQAEWVRRINDEAKGLVDEYWDAITEVAGQLLNTPLEWVEVENTRTGGIRTAGIHRLSGEAVRSTVNRLAGP